MLYSFSKTLIFGTLIINVSSSHTVDKLKQSALCSCYRLFYLAGKCLVLYMIFQIAMIIIINHICITAQSLLPSNIFNQLIPSLPTDLFPSIVSWNPSVCCWYQRLNSSFLYSLLIWSSLEHLLILLEDAISEACIEATKTFACDPYHCNFESFNFVSLFTFFQKMWLVVSHIWNMP